jgi:hypothetical protein
MKSTAPTISSIDRRLADKAVFLSRTILDIMEQYDISNDTALKHLKIECEEIQMLFAERCLRLVRKSENYQAGTFMKG